MQIYDHDTMKSPGWTPYYQRWKKPGETKAGCHSLDSATLASKTCHNAYSSKHLLFRGRSAPSTLFQLFTVPSNNSRPPSAVSGVPECSQKCSQAPVRCPKARRWIGQHGATFALVSGPVCMCGDRFRNEETRVEKAPGVLESHPPLGWPETGKTVKQTI